MQIVVRQISGLGNQLFQYAAGQYYAKTFGAPMRLAIDPPARAHSYGLPRPFLLSHFRITAPYEVLTKTEAFMLAQRSSLRGVAAIYQRLAGVQVWREPESLEHSFAGNPVLQPGVKSLWVVGYWQSQEMVGRVEAEVRREFRFRQPAEGRDAEVLEQIASAVEPVSLHVRRGDYTLAAEGNRALSLDYYDRAIGYLRERLRNPTFFVFSDDIAYTREHLPKDIRTVFVDHNDSSSSHGDIRLMSACHHHIIANSSFSWWGAWLNARPDRMVVAPKYWLLTRESYFPGLFPPGWEIAEFEPRPSSR